MRHQTLVNVLLIIAGVLLAIALFAAGVLWRSRAGSKASQLETGSRNLLRGGATRTCMGFTDPRVQAARLRFFGAE